MGVCCPVPFGNLRLFLFLLFLFLFLSHAHAHRSDDGASRMKLSLSHPTLFKARLREHFKKQEFFGEWGLLVF